MVWRRHCNDPGCVVSEQSSRSDTRYVQDVPDVQDVQQDVQAGATNEGFARWAAKASGDYATIGRDGREAQRRARETKRPVERGKWREARYGSECRLLGWPSRDVGDDEDDEEIALLHDRGQEYD